jgi:hypothetical protein
MITALINTYLLIGFIIGIYLVVESIDDGTMDDAGGCVFLLLLVTFIWPVVFTLRSN